MVTRAKLNRGVTDAIFSYGVTKTIINPFQFKPVLKYLDSAMERMLIADEVGLGKTIEAGLLWTEMAARGQANRVMVVCPAALVPKWQREMSERFGFELEHYKTADLRRMVDRLEAGTLPQNFAAVVSIQTFRTFDRLSKWRSSTSHWTYASSTRPTRCAIRVPQASTRAIPPRCFWFPSAAKRDPAQSRQ
jgi:SNF2 family DNA or RNA helicase